MICSNLYTSAAVTVERSSGGTLRRIRLAAHVVRCAVLWPFERERPREQHVQANADAPHIRNLPIVLLAKRGSPLPPQFLKQASHAAAACNPCRLYMRCPQECMPGHPEIQRSRHAVGSSLTVGSLAHTSSKRTSGAMYSGVPQLLSHCLEATSTWLKPKSHSLSCGRRPRPCSSMLSSCTGGTIDVERVRTLVSEQH